MRIEQKLKEKIRAEMKEGKAKRKKRKQKKIDKKLEGLRQKGNDALAKQAPSELPSNPDQSQKDRFHDYLRGVKDVSCLRSICKWCHYLVKGNDDSTELKFKRTTKSEVKKKMILDLIADNLKSDRALVPIFEASKKQWTLPGSKHFETIDSS